MAIGIMGGTFNPIHHGHLLTAREVASRLLLEKVYFIPVFLPPHKGERDIASAAHRLKMAELGAGEDERFQVSPVELDRKGTSYTIDTLRELKKDIYPAKDFFLSWARTPFLKFQPGKRPGRFFT